MAPQCYFRRGGGCGVDAMLTTATWARCQGVVHQLMVFGRGGCYTRYHQGIVVTQPLKGVGFTRGWLLTRVSPTPVGCISSTGGEPLQWVASTQGLSNRGGLLWGSETNYLNHIQQILHKSRSIQISTKSELLRVRNDVDSCWLHLQSYWGVKWQP